MNIVRFKNYWVTCLLVIILGLFTFSGYATTYYVSNSGNDSNSGHTTALAWKTLTKVNSFTFQPGDQVLFQRGSTFYGTLIIKNSGTAGSPIVYGAHGTGSNPVITGFSPVTAWTNLGSNIWESTNAVSTLSYLNIVTINGVNTPMGRTPNIGGYYTLQSHNANLSITSSNLSGTPNWSGAEVVIRKKRWIWQTGQITSQSGSTINYTDEGQFTPQDDWGFFIQDDTRTLDVQNEWYYNPTTNKIRIYSTSQPINVKVASSEYAISCTSKSYLTIQNLTIAGGNTSSINILGGSNIVISNCIINHSGLDGINFSWSSYCTITNNIIKNSNYSAINGSGRNNYEIISNNMIDSSAMIIGIGRLHGPGAIYTSGENALIQYNNVDHSGYNGIFPTMATGQVRNNFINNSLLNRGDGGGIYTAEAHTNLIIDGNIIDNTKGYGGAMKASDISVGIIARGIYLDMSSSNVTVSNNTVANGKGYGIFINQRSFSNSVTNNTCYNNESSQFSMSDHTSVVGVTYNNAITENKFIAKTATQYVMKFQSSINNIPSWLSTMNNNYHARPIADGNSIAAIQPSEFGAPAYKTLEQWKLFSLKDTSSSKSPQSVLSENDLQFEYNATKTARTIILSKPMIDVKGTKYATSVTLQPYTSIVLMKDANPNLGDVIAPVVTGFSIPATSTSLSIPINTLSASDNIGVTGYLLTETSTKPSSIATGWSITKPTSYTFTSAGTKSLYAWAKDAVGNVSVSLSEQVAITLTSTANTFNTLGNTGVYSGTSTAANRRAMPVTFSEDGSIQSISIYHNGGTGNVMLGVYSDQPGNPSSQLGVTSSTLINTTAGWQTISLASPVTVSAGQIVWLAWVFQNNPGVRYMAGTPGRAQSPATWSGGMPATFGASTIAGNKFSIYCTYKPGIDITKPIVTAFTIPATSSSLTVPVILTATDNVAVTGYKLTETSAAPNAEDAGWAAGAPTSYTFPSEGEGTKTLFAWVKDVTGNVSLPGIGKQIVITLPSGNASLGNTEVYSGTTTAANRRAMPVTFTEAGTIQSLSIYHNGGTGNLLMGVYSDQSGLPSTQLGITVATVINTAAGWQTVSLTSPVTVTSGQKVWLAWVFQNSPGVRYMAGTPGRAQSTATWSGGMPTTFGVSTVAGNKFSIYCTYIVDETKSAEIKSAKIATETETFIENTNLNAYPNPFTDKLNIEFSNPGDTQAKLEIYNIAGSRLETLFNGPVNKDELYIVEYLPKLVGSQIVLYRLTMNGKTQVGKLIYNQKR